MAGKLREAASRGNTQQVLRLLEDGVKIQADENGRNALHLAASAGHADVVASLLLAGCDVNVSDSSGCTALQRAAADGRLEVVQQLIKHGADSNRQDNVHGNTALHEASWKGHSHCVETLGKARANLHLKNCGGFAALHLCCQNGHNQSCRELLLAGCNPDLQNNYGDTPLHTSARYGHAGVTRILISAQCRVSDQNKNGDTALHIAAAMGRRKLTRILLEAGCDKNLKNKQNETARDIATRKDLNEILVILGTSSSRTKNKSGKHEKERNDKKREKNESGTSSKDSSTRHKDKKKHKNNHKVHFEKATGKQWSPYGCHYYPDPKAFPEPNLDSLPHEPLRKGEQYFLDLAGNICKGPVGVGYTCYCAPFFRHMEARLDRDKQELKEHIDQAHLRLDQKVSSLERRTQGQLTELTRCVVAERALCDHRHQHLAQWVSRGTMGRSSERVRSSAPLPLPRARSLELLLDERGDPSDRGRSLQVLAHDCDISGWRRQTHRSSAHELAGSPRLGSGTQPSSRHNRSFDALVDRQSAPFRGQSHRKSANELPTPCTNTQSHPHPQHNRSFETLVGDSTNPWPAHHRLVDLPPASPQPQQVDPSLNKTWEGQVLQRSTMEENKEQRSPKQDQEQVNSAEWRGQPLRRSVHEMVARIQNAQANQAFNNWKERQQRVNQVETKLEDNISWEKQNYERTSWRGDKREPGSRYRHREDEASSESSEGEDDHDRLPAFKEPGMMGSGIPDYENVGSCPWQVEATELVSEMPYRSRSTVYSPTMDTDLHNDSGYSTKLYGSSKGPSPSLSGNLECEHLIPGQPVFPTNKLCDGMQRPHSATRTRFEREDPIGTNIVAASLV